jgi:hypothetical protein
MGGLLVILRRVFSQRLVYHALAWTLTICLAKVYLYAAWHGFDNRYVGGHRNDGNGGHATIDFGGQYLMGRLLARGHGQDLYNRSVQRLTLLEVYPPEDQDPKAERSDVENLMFWVMGTDPSDAPHVLGSFLAPLAAGDAPGAAVLVAAEQAQWGPGRPEAAASDLLPLAATDPLGAVALIEAGHPEQLRHAAERRAGGPLYPPVNAFYVAPLGLLSPRAAYRVQQVTNLLLAFVAGLGFSVLSRGRIWWPVATLVIFLFPGYMGSINLGQNATLTLTMLVWGWALIARGRPGWGGLVWGLLAFKPVWAMVFFLVLVLTRRWRAGACMLLAGAGLGLLTLPFVGVDSWLDWLRVGREAAELYDTDHNWIFLSRDVLSIPRRWLLNFGDNGPRELVRHADPAGASCWWYWLCGGGDIPGWLVPALAGWGMLVAFLEMTVRLAALRKEQARAVTGPPAAFLLLGAWLCCYHFMYYDVLLAALPVLLLFAEPGRYLEPRYLTNVPLGRLGAAGAWSRWYHVDDGPTCRLAVALRVLLVILVLLAELSLWAVLEVFSLHELPWQVLVPVGGAVALWLLVFLGVAAVFVARVARPLVRPPEYRSRVVLNRAFPSLLLLLLLTQPLCPLLGIGSYFGPPWDTFVLIAMWLWAGGYWLWTRPPPGEAKPPTPAEKRADGRLALPV